MGKPTELELKTALKHAARMRESGSDPYYVAKALLNHNYRIKHLEKVMRAAELYIHSGMGATEHLRLIRAISTCHEKDQHSAGVEPTYFALY